MARQVEILEALGGQHAGAVHGAAHIAMLFADEHADAVACQPFGGIEPPGSPANDEDVHECG